MINALNAGKALVKNMQKLRLGSAAKAVYDDRLTYLSFSRMLRLQKGAAAALRRVHDGSVAEFGVALGGSAIVLAGLAVKSARSFHGFDVFGMIPPPTSNKDDPKSKSRFDAIASGQAKGIGGDAYYGYRDDLYDHVKASFSRHGLPVDGHRICLHRGLFEDTLPKVDMGMVAFAHVDCDWYDPVHHCLSVLHERTRSGSVIIIDDYNDYSGCRTAIDEFIAKHRQYILKPGTNVILERVED